MAADTRRPSRLSRALVASIRTSRERPAVASTTTASISTASERAMQVMREGWLYLQNAPDPLAR